MDTTKAQIAQTNAYWSSKGVNVTRPEGYHEYCMERIQREEEVGMFDTCAIFKDEYEELMSNGSKVSYEFKHILIESHDPVHIIDINGATWLGITDITSHPDSYNVFIRRDDINSAFQRYLIDNITENLIACNRLIDTDKAHNRFHSIDSYSTYRDAFACIKFYNTYVVPMLGVEKLVLFTTTDKSGKVTVHFA